MVCFSGGNFFHIHCSTLSTYIVCLTRIYIFHFITIFGTWFFLKLDTFTFLAGNLHMIFVGLMDKNICHALFGVLWKWKAFYRWHNLPCCWSCFRSRPCFTMEVSHEICFQSFATTSGMTYCFLLKISRSNALIVVKSFVPACKHHRTAESYSFFKSSNNKMREGAERNSCTHEILGLSHPRKFVCSRSLKNWKNHDPSCNNSKGKYRKEVKICPAGNAASHSLITKESISVV